MIMSIVLFTLVVVGTFTSFSFSLSLSLNSFSTGSKFCVNVNKGQGTNS